METLLEKAGLTFEVFSQSKHGSQAIKVAPSSWQWVGGREDQGLNAGGTASPQNRIHIAASHTHTLAQVERDRAWLEGGVLWQCVIVPAYLTPQDSWPCCRVVLPIYLQTDGSKASLQPGHQLLPAWQAYCGHTTSTSCICTVCTFTQRYITDTPAL